MADGLNNFFESASNKLGRAIGNPTAQTRPRIATDGGTVRGPFLQPDPQTLISSYYFPTGISRTQGGIPSVSLAQTNRESTFNESDQTLEPSRSFQQVGFTPIEYYRSDSGHYKLSTPINKLRRYEEAEAYSRESLNDIGDIRTHDFKFKLKDYVEFISDKTSIYTSDGSGADSINSWTKTPDQNPFRLMQYQGTPADNEDPVYFGFEIILNVDSSPLFNGEIERFIDSIGATYDEVKARREIIDKFKIEIQKYFKLDMTLDTEGELQSIIDARPNADTSKKYYVKKIAGLDKLIESNTANTRKSFTDYGKDILTITFYEDTSLNLGRLAALYKLLYWSRLRGKSIIPENLLRFDCEIIISELRNFVKLKKTDNVLEVLKSNLSRYRYNVYECQFWFNKMTHPDSVDLSQTPTPTDTYDVEISFKYSTMVYEQYEGSDLKLRNSTIDPLARVSEGLTASATREYIPPSINESTPSDALIFTKTIDTLANLFPEESAEGFGVLSPQNTIDNLKKSEKNNIYNLIRRPIPEQDITSSKPNLFGRAAEQLVEGIKNAALKEAQRQLNIRFRLLNDSIDRIRNAFGIGRMSAPRNVYFPKQNTGPYGQSTFFFDVQNSLRNFAGDTLTGLIGGG